MPTTVGTSIDQVLIASAEGIMRATASAWSRGLHQRLVVRVSSRQTQDETRHRIGSICSVKARLMPICSLYHGDSASMQFRGIYAPLTTPFDHQGNVYRSKFDHNLSQLRRTRLSGFVVADRWGEGLLLAEGEKVDIWRRAVAQSSGKADILAAISGSGVAVTRELLSQAAKAGCTAAIIEAPDTGKLAPETETADLFYRSVADSATLPLLVGTRLDGADEQNVGRLAGLAAHPGISGTVVRNCNPAFVRDARRACGPEFAIVVQDLEGAVPCLEAGASAAILALAAVVPFYVLSIEEAVRTREHTAALELVARALDFDLLLQRHGVPALKRALDFRSGYGGRPRLPLSDVSNATSEAISLALYELAS